MIDNIIGTYDFPPQKRGDTFSSVTFTINVDGVPLNCSGSNVLVQFRAKDYVPPALEFSTESGSVLIQGDDFNVIRLVERSGSEMLLNPDTYHYDVDIEFPDGSNKTYIQGTLPIITDYSRRHV